MKSIKYIGIFAFTALMGLCSCSTDKLSNDSTVSQSKGHKVSLTIGSGAKTRAAEPTDLGGFAREKAIDGDKLYAVVFDQQGKFFEAIKITDYNSGDNTCSFTLSEAGVFYGYIVANTSIDLTSASLTKGSSDEDALYNLIEDTDPGTALAASTNFMMTSKRTLFDVDGDADTNLGSVSLIRSAARIDIDATEIDGLEVTKVVVENRYKKSLLVRGNNPDDTSLGAATPTDTKTYTRGTSAGEVDALNDGTGLVNDRQWQGVIYGYENINTNTVVKITHTLNGVASTTTLDFSTINGGQAIKRNNIYTVKLTNEVLSPTLHNIVASITVEDWDNSVNLAYTDLTDHEKPDYIVTSGHYASEFTSSNLNPAHVRALIADSPTEITLQVTSQGKVASNVSFVDKNSAAYDFFGEGGSIDPVGESTLVNGKIVQNYKITIPQTLCSTFLASDYFTFKVHNVFDDTSAASREFKVKVGECLQVVRNEIEAGGDYERYVGYAVTSDNFIYEDYATAAAYGNEANIIGMIAYLGPKGTADLSTGSENYYGLIIGNQNDDAIVCQWSPESPSTTPTYVTSSVAGLGYGNSITNMERAIADKYGIIYTDRMCRTNNTGTGLYDGWGTNASLYAGHKARNCGLGGITGETETTSDWFLPANGQWIMALNAAYHKVQNTTTDAITTSTAFDNVYSTGVELTAYKNMQSLMTNAFGSATKSLTFSDWLGSYWTSSEGHTTPNVAYYSMAVVTNGTGISPANLVVKTYSDGWATGTGARLRSFMAF